MSGPTSLYLTAMGFAFHSPNQRDKKLTAEGAAEMFWSILIELLQH